MAKEDSGELILYLFPGSYWSQVGMLFFHEKGMPYTPRYVTLSKLENLEPWFLKLNPRGQVPVIQDGETVVAGSDLIFSYMEDKFKDGYPKMSPPKGSQLFDKVQEFDKLLRTVPNHLLTHGVLFFPELSTGVSMPKIEQEMRVAVIKNFEDFLNKAEERLPGAREAIKERRQFFSSARQTLSSKDDVQKGITKTDHILDLIEKELGSHTKDQKDWWMCCELFTTADVILGVLLNRLDALGLSTTLLDPATKPHLCRYKERLEQRPTYRAFLEDVRNKLREHLASVNK